MYVFHGVLSSPQKRGCNAIRALRRVALAFCFREKTKVPRLSVCNVYVDSLVSQVFGYDYEKLRRELGLDTQVGVKVVFGFSRLEV